MHDWARVKLSHLQILEKFEFSFVLNQVAVECGASAWRVSKLDDVAFYSGTATAVTAMVARDGRILRLALDMAVAGQAGAKSRKPRSSKPEVPDTVSLAVADTAAVARWLPTTLGA